MTGRVADNRAALVGATIAGVTGAAWSGWAASGLSGPTRIVVAVVGIASGVVIVARSLRLRRTATRAEVGGPSMFGTRSYRIVVAAEVAVLVAGAAVLGAGDHQRYVVVWIAAVVGVHFLVFGILFARRYLAVGAGLILAAAVGVALAGSHERSQTVTAVVALISAVTLLLAGAETLVAVSYSRSS